jgi:hypothetical protein
MNNQKNFLYYRPDFDQELSKIETFLRSFTDKNIETHNIHEQRKYMIELVNINNLIYKHLNSKR